MKRRDLDHLAELLREFAIERDWEQFHSPKNLAMALTVETAELQEHFQWMTEVESAKPSPEKLQQIREEIGDVLIYLTCFADKLGIDPLDAAYKKLEINRQKYPVEKARGSAKKYTEL
ncbi:MAG: nucleotide pyrophosphohydrolase [Deltaproteobacteria bacterium HGW-Deltaproteobacteria-1]|jgi:NTP pyrophosphatase (non-canonical NTP hydrolase)|nr:MAG: nucleotide pyrophosphohydrolase [Deltaproteobacteria bacterium HGW-Deltaproteobacteria-1]